MHIRPYHPGDLDRLIELTIATFRPFYEESFPAMLNCDRDLIAHEHGHWQDDYRTQVPQLHDPASGKRVAVAADDDGTVIGYIAWHPDNARPQQGIIFLLAVDPARRRERAGTALMAHAMGAMREAGIRYVELGTGGDEFHAPARALYESLGFYRIPTVHYLRAL